MLAKNRPTHHVDIGSCLRFATLVSAFIPFEFYDYRPATVTLSDLKSHHADLLQLPFGDNSLPSLSCMHVVEHIGLERYGDPFDPKGDLKAMGELSRVLARGGCLLFVVPIGGEARIQYNAHRIYTYQMITNYFDKLTLCSFSLITDCGCYIENATDEDTMRQKYGCGCFVFIKK